MRTKRARTSSRSDDGVVDSSDNCPVLSNVAQLDTDGDGLGDGAPPLRPAQCRRYRVRAINAFGNGNWSDAHEACTNPAAPTVGWSSDAIENPRGAE